MKHPRPLRPLAQSPLMQHFKGLLDTVSCDKWPRDQAQAAGTIPRSIPGGGGESRIGPIHIRHCWETGEERLQLSRLLKKLNAGNYISA